MIKINLYGPPSCGKSTIAAFVFGNLKLLGLNAELVSEYAKELAWMNQNIKDKGSEIQTEIFLHQLSLENRLEGKVDFLVTDSPLLLNAYYGRNPLTKEIAIQKLSTKEFHFWLTKTDMKFETEGRVHTEKESQKINSDMYDYLINTGINLVVVDVPVKDRAEWIIQHVLNNSKK